MMKISLIFTQCLMATILLAAALPAKSAAFGSVQTICLPFAGFKYARVGTWYDRDSGLSQDYSAIGARMKVTGGWNRDSGWYDASIGINANTWYVGWSLYLYGSHSRIWINGDHRATLPLTDSKVHVSPSKIFC